MSKTAFSAGTGVSLSTNTLSVDAAQTGITSLLATDIKIGEDDQTKIDFETADTINFYAGNEKQLILTDGALTPGANNILDLGSSSVEFKDAFFDGTVTSDAFAGPLTGDVTGDVTSSGTIQFANLSDGTITITGFVDEDDMSSNSATLIPTQQSVEARIQAVNGTANNVTGLTATGAELNAVADVSAITIDTSTAITNADGLAVYDASAGSIGYFDVDLLDTYYASTTQTLTNKSIDGGQLTGSVATARLDVGTTANKLVQLDGSARLPAVDGSQLTNVVASDPSALAFAIALG